MAKVNINPQKRVVGEVGLGHGWGWGVGGAWVGLGRGALGSQANTI